VWVLFQFSTLAQASKASELHRTFMDTASSVQRLDELLLSYFDVDVFAQRKVVLAAWMARALEIVPSAFHLVLAHVVVEDQPVPVLRPASFGQWRDRH